MAFRFNRVKFMSHYSRARTPQANPTPRPDYPAQPYATSQLFTRQSNFMSQPDTFSEYFSTWRGRLIRHAGLGRWPCDDIELERQEAQHWLLRLLLGFPFIGPVIEVLNGQKAVPRVLDVATSTGAWAIDMAELFPFAEVVGTDTMPVQPE